MKQCISLHGAACMFAGVALIAGCAGTKKASESSPSSATGAEQVDIGYGTQARQDLTSSVASVSSDEIERSSATTLAEVLKGRVAGLQVIESPNGTVQIRIRGVNSFYNSSEPLFVIDGIPMTPGLGNPLWAINPRDISSIDVLKDAAATAIYGARGANGVILIRTKRGR